MLFVCVRAEQSVRERGRRDRASKRLSLNVNWTHVGCFGACACVVCVSVFSFVSSLPHVLDFENNIFFGSWQDLGYAGSRINFSTTFTPVAGSILLQRKVSIPHAGRTTKFAP